MQLKGGETDIVADLTFADGAAEVLLAVPEAHLWSDKDPYLYDLTVRTENDAYSLKVGIRTIAVTGGKILLNGQPVKLNGFGRHEDFVASGKGLNLPLVVKDYQLMKWVGANAYRTSHYPYSEEEMQMADREGFLIIDEIPAVSLQMADEANAAERLRMCLQQIGEMIARDKNHPSVVMWCGQRADARLAVGASCEKAFIEDQPAGQPRYEIARSASAGPDACNDVTVMGGPQN